MNLQSIQLHVHPTIWTMVIMLVPFKEASQICDYETQALIEWLATLLVEDAIIHYIGSEQGPF